MAIKRKWHFKVICQNFIAIILKTINKTTNVYKINYIKISTVNNKIFITNKIKD